MEHTMKTLTELKIARVTELEAMLGKLLWQVPSKRAANYFEIQKVEKLLKDARMELSNIQKSNLKIIREAS
jgi:uncharacterized protein YecE (DUF72 family)